MTKPRSKMFSARLPLDLFRKVDQARAAHRITRSEFARDAFTRSIADSQRAASQPKERT